MISTNHLEMPRNAKDTTTWASYTEHTYFIKRSHRCCLFVKYNYDRKDRRKETWKAHPHHLDPLCIQLVNMENQLFTGVGKQIYYILLLVNTVNCDYTFFVTWYYPIFKIRNVIQAHVKYALTYVQKMKKGCLVDNRKVLCQLIFFPFDIRLPKT